MEAKNEIVQLMTIADEFGSIAGKVNESSIKRKSIAENILKTCGDTETISNQIYDGLKKVSKMNREWADKDNRLLSVSYMLKSNLEKQLNYIELIKKSNLISSEIMADIYNITTAALNSILEAQKYINSVLVKEYELILLDDLLEKKKAYQLKSINTLIRSVKVMFDDAENAIAGSNSNFQRSSKLTDEIKKISEYIDGKNNDKLKNLLSDVIAGKTIAEEVNKSSNSQFIFNEKVNQFVKYFFEDSMSIKDLMKEKHNLFEENIQIITIYSVIFSMDFKKYLDIELLIKNIPYPKEIRTIVNDLIFTAEIAVSIIKDITKLSYDMTSICHENNETETSAYELSNEEIKCFEKIKAMVNDMTEVTKYPVEGSSKNIINASKIAEIISGISGGDKTENTKQPSEIVQTISKSVSAKPESSGKKRIMVIDDSSAVRMVIRRVLNENGYDTVDAVDGANALSLLNGEKYDLFLCDVNMPIMNGIEFLEKIKNDIAYSDYKFTPTIMLTTESGESMKDKGKELGAKAWMVKPFQPEELLKRIKPLMS